MRRLLIPLLLAALFLTGATYQQTTIPTDSASGSVMTIDIAHKHAHDGEAYVIAHSGTKNSTEYIGVCFTTPASGYTHMIGHASGSGASTFEIGEGATATGGSAATAINRNRNSANTSGLTSPVTDPTISSLGTTIFALGIGAGQNEGGSYRNDLEFALKSSTKYCYKLTSGAASNALKLVLSWYE